VVREKWIWVERRVANLSGVRKGRRVEQKVKGNKLQGRRAIVPLGYVPSGGGRRGGIFFYNGK